jgi:hypothetical protein
LIFSSAAGLRLDGQPAEFAFPEGDKTAGEQIALELLQSRYGIIFDGLDSGIAAQIRNWTGTSSELQTFIETSIRTFEGLPEAAAAAAKQADDAWNEMQAVLDRINGTHGGKTVDQMAAEFQQSNAWAAGMTVTELVQQFLTITKEDYLGYSEAQRALIRDITSLGYSAEEAAGTIGDVTDAMAGFSGVYGFSAERLAERQAAREAAEALERLAEAASNAREGIARTLEESLFGPNSPLDPTQQLTMANQSFWDLIGRASIGDIGAMEELPEAFNRLIELANGYYASGSGFQEIFQLAFNAMAGIGDVPDYNERMLSASEQAADVAQSTYEVNVDVREILIQIRDQAPRVAEASADRMAHAMKTATLATDRR